MDGIQGQVSHSYVLVYTFAFYPTQKMAGDHMARIHTSDSTPAGGHVLTTFAAYATAPAISGWGLVLLVLVMIVSGLTLYRRGLSSAGSG